MYSGSNLAPGGITQTGSQPTIAGVVDQIATSVQLDPRACEQVVGTVLSVLHHEDQVHADAIFAKIPGAAELAQAYDVMSPETTGGGVLSTLINRIDAHFAEPVQAGINGLNRLAQCGLSPAQLRSAATILFSQIRSAAGPAAVSNALASAPALKSSLGM